MTQVQTIGGLKRGRGRGRGTNRGRGRGGRGAGRNEKPAAFEAFKGSGNSLGAQQASSNPYQHSGGGSGVVAAEQQHLAGIAKLQQQHDEALALRAVQLAELQRQQQQPQEQQAHTSPPILTEADIPTQVYLQPQGPSSTTDDNIIDLCDDDTTQPVQQSSNLPRPPAKPREKASWSMGVDRASSGSATSTSNAGTDNPFWCPARYVPTGGEDQPDLHLQTHEVVQVLDSGLVAHRGTAVLDTGMPVTTAC